jgi:hypothetical protein
MDDVTNTFPSSAGPTVFQSSQVGGISGGSSNAVGSITVPIAAWRLTVTSTGGSATSGRNWLMEIADDIAAGRAAWARLRNVRFHSAHVGQRG